MQEEEAEEEEEFPNVTTRDTKVHEE